MILSFIAAVGMSSAVTAFVGTDMGMAKAEVAEKRAWI